jgi:Tfp pilus assembly PilM family ATPase/Tfp pilus assembly protein PilN
MRLRSRASVTGLDISQNWLRVVELRETPNGIFLERVGVHATPQGAVMRGYIVDAPAVGAAVRTLYESHNIRSRSVVVGVPASQITARISRVPSVSPQEMRLLAQGEVEHFRLLPQGEGTFDFVTLGGESAGRDGGEEGAASILLIAMEEQIVNTYAQVVQAADLQLVALEPRSIACIRALYPHLLAQPTTALVTVGDNSTTLSILQNGALCYYRVLEGGVLRLGEMAGQVDELVLELQRSLDFYHREMRVGEPVSSMQLTLDTTQFGGLDQYLSAQLGMPVETHHPFDRIRSDPARLAPDFLEEVGQSFTTAFGLALHQVDDELLFRDLPSHVTAVVDVAELPDIPRIDLSTREKEKRALTVSHRALLVSLGISLFVALFLNFAAMVFNSYATQRQDALDKVEAELVRVNQQIQQQQALLDQVTAAMGKAREKGPPYAQVLLELASAMPPNAWITSFGKEPDGSLRIEGKALSPFIVATTMRRIGRSGLAHVPKLISMRRETEKGEMFHFEMRVPTSFSAPSPPAPGS